MPWGAPNVSKVRRPQPYRIDAFSSPEAQASSIVELLKRLLIDRAQQPKDGADGSTSALAKLKDYISSVQKNVLEESKTEVERIEKELSGLVTEVFRGFKVTFEAKPDEISDKAINLFSTSPVLRMGPEDGHLAPIDKQGSGARRTLLWATLKLLGEQAPAGKAAKKPKKVAVDGAEPDVERPHVLLIDEPETCLHPSAIRDACRVLYDLAKPGSGWQVMVTTHSPVFIDLARQNTTIARVERSESGAVEGTTIFRPDRAQLDDDDRDRLKMLNVWDPYVAEFFFGGRTVLVEGDTEYSAFRYLLEENRDLFPNVHVVRARGKAILVPLIKILNHFGSGYSVLHDSDRPKRKDGNNNAMWTENEKVLEAVNSCPDPKRVRLIACVPNFEEALLGSPSGTDKPYRVFTKLKLDTNLKSNVLELLKSLLDPSIEPPPRTLLSWSTLDELEKALQKQESASGSAIQP